MTSMDTRNATPIPVARIAYSIEVKANPYFSIFRRLAPAITGMARINVNSPSVRSLPVTSLVPGITTSPLASYLLINTILPHFCVCSPFWETIICPIWPSTRTNKCIYFIIMTTTIIN